MTKEIDSGSFQGEVLDSKVPVLVDFWAPWCGPCRMIAPALEELSSVYEGKVNIVKLNIDDNQDIAQKYGIRSIPTMLIFENGEVSKQKVGASAKSSIEEFIKSVL